jgi:integrase
MVSGNGAGDGLRHAKPESGAMERLRDRMVQELRVRGLIQKLLGDRHIETTTIYTHLTDCSMGRVQEALGLMTAAL